MGRYSPSRSRLRRAASESLASSIVDGYRDKGEMAVEAVDEANDEDEDEDGEGARRAMRTKTAKARPRRVLAFCLAEFQSRVSHMSLSRRHAGVHERLSSRRGRRTHAYSSGQAVVLAGCALLIYTAAICSTTGRDGQLSEKRNGEDGEGVPIARGNYR